MTLAIPLTFEQTMRALFVDIFGGEPSASWLNAEDHPPLTLIEAGAYSSERDALGDPLDLTHATYSYLTGSQCLTCYVEVTIRRGGRVIHLGPLEDLDLKDLPRP